MKKKFEIKDKKAALMWVFEIAVVLLLAAVVSIFFCQSVVMQEGSMEPTLKTGQEFLINKVSYKLGEPKRGDIIVFKKDAKEHSSLHIKRIVGLPGEKIQIKDGVLYIDGNAYKEEYPQISNPGLAEQQITLGKNEYFVLGDNRNNSEDSRFANVGNVKYSSIIGRIWAISSPFGRMGIIK